MFKPFANSSDSIGIGELTVENRTDRIECYGNLTLTKDKAGLALAKELKKMADAVVQSLEGQNLPDTLPPPKNDKVKNPFG